MADTLKFTLDEESEKKLFELLTDVDVSKTPSFSIKDKHGNEAEYVKVVRCKDCKHWDGKYQYCEIIDDSRDWDADDYCSVAERKEE